MTLIAKDNFKIKHVTQPTLDTCVSACMSMLSGVEVEEIVSQFHEAYTNRKVSMEEMMVALNIPFIPLYGFPATYCGFLYLGCMPSLNVPGKLHQLLLDARVEGQIRYYDPAKGLVERIYYKHSDDKRGFYNSGKQMAFLTNEFNAQFIIPTSKGFQNE